MVKFNLRKMFAVGLLSATAAFAGVAAMHGAPSVIAYANSEVTTPTTTPEKPKKTAEIWGNEDGSFSIGEIELDGSYIYVDYYTDEDCKKLKATFTYTSAEVENAGSINLGNLSLKKGGWFKVYDELTDVNKVETITVAPQVEKIKVKVNDISKDTLLEALTITVGSTSITPENAKDYKIFIGYESLTSSDGKVNDTILADLKIGARAAGLTVIVRYGGKVSTGSDPEVVAMPTEAKVKIPAAAKAPKVVVDYVNGTYTIPKGSNYFITTVSADDGSINLPAKDAKPVEATAKTPLEIDDILKASVAEGAPMPSSAAIIVYTTKEKKLDSMQTVMLVTNLPALTVDKSDTDATKATKDKGSVKLGETEVASLVFSADGVVIEAKAANGVAYYNETTKKWVVVKNGAKSKGVVPLKNDDTAELKIKVLGKKASKGVDPEFGSAALPITNSYKEVAAPTTSPTPTTSPAPSGTPETPEE